MKSNVYSLVRHIIQCKYHTLISFRIGDCNFRRDFILHSRNYKDMLRSSSRISDIQRLRQKIKGKSIKYVCSANMSLQVLGSGACGAPRCVYLSAGNTSYIFNCGEGTQKLAHEHKYKLVKLEHVFITSANWDNLGGMPGMLLTIQDAGVPKINIHGPKGTVEIFDAIKRFVLLQNLRVHEATCDESQPYTDQVMSVSYIPIAKSTRHNTESTDLGEEMVDNINYYDYVTKSNTRRILESRIEGKKRQPPTIGQNSDRKLISQVMSYICKLHPRQGKLSLEACVEKGVKPGPLLGQLKAGEDVTLEDGTVVYSKDVCSPPIPGPTFLVVDCPSEDYLESFVNHPAFARLQTATLGKDDAPYCVVHFTSQDVMNDSRYVDWMGKFGSYTRHIVVNEENECMGTEACHKHQHKLHMLHPEIFPFLNEDCFQKKTRTGDPCIIHRPRTHHTVHLQPELKFDTENEVSLHPQEYVNEIFEIDGFLDALAELQTNINAQTKSLSIVNDYPKILMLGTGSSIPNKVRNTSGILLQMDESHSILLDCGEGTFGQIVKFYGRSEMYNIMRSIKAIYVSHLHADHHIGLIDLIIQRRKVTQDPLYLLAPGHILAWLQLYHKRFEPILHQITLISNSEFFMDVPTGQRYKNMYKSLNVRAVRTVYVSHCPYSYGVSVELNNGQKIVYSGDTMPCEDLVKLGQDCDLLIHEATMEDDLVKEAKLKYHSTVSQAIQMGQQMRSKFTLLTHFSQRYAAIPHLSQSEDDLRNVGIAYDNMQVSLSQLPLLPLMYPTLKLMFNKHYVELEERAAKRQRLTNQ